MFYQIFFRIFIHFLSPGVPWASSFPLLLGIQDKSLPRDVVGRFSVYPIHQHLLFLITLSMNWSHANNFQELHDKARTGVGSIRKICRMEGRNTKVIEIRDGDRDGIRGLELEQAGDYDQC